MLQVRTPSLRTDVRDLGASYNVANGSAEIRDVKARLLGGELRGSATVRDLAGKQEGKATVAVRSISLAALKSIANSASLRPVALSGKLDANSEATWNGAVENLVLRADGKAAGNIASSQWKPGSPAIPLNADVHARYNGTTQEVAFKDSYLRTPQTSVNLDGTVSQHSALAVKVQSNDLHELETVADLFSPPAQPLDLHGMASFNGSVRGSTRAPQIAGQLNASNVRVRGSEFRVLRTSVQANPSQVSLQNGVLDVGKQGHVTFDVQSGPERLVASAVESLYGECEGQPVVGGGAGAGGECEYAGDGHAERQCHGARHAAQSHWAGRSFAAQRNDFRRAGADGRCPLPGNVAMRCTPTCW